MSIDVNLRFRTNEFELDTVLTESSQLTYRKSSSGSLQETFEYLLRAWINLNVYPKVYDEVFFDVLPHSGVPGSGYNIEDSLIPTINGGGFHEWLNQSFTGLPNEPLIIDGVLHGGGQLKTYYRGVFLHGDNHDEPWRLYQVINPIASLSTFGDGSTVDLDTAVARFNAELERDTKNS